MRPIVKVLVISGVLFMSIYVGLAAVLMLILEWPHNIVLAAITVGGSATIFAMKARDELAGRPTCSGC